MEPLLGRRRVGRRGEACLRLLPCSDTDTVSSGATQLDMLTESNNQLRGVWGASCLITVPWDVQLKSGGSCERWQAETLSRLHSSLVMKTIS